MLRCQRQMLADHNICLLNVDLDSSISGENFSYIYKGQLPRHVISLNNYLYQWMLKHFALKSTFPRLLLYLAVPICLPSMITYEPLFTIECNGMHSRVHIESQQGYLCCRLVSPMPKMN